MNDQAKQLNDLKTTVQITSSRIESLDKTIQEIKAIVIRKDDK